MPGLDPNLVSRLDFSLSLKRVETDVATDFLLAPHYSAVYAHAGADLIEIARSRLSDGSYNPELPITVEVPKPSGLSRPGAILRPLDRLIYQFLVDQICDRAEAQLDRSRVFSHALLEDDREFKMFRPADECYRGLLAALAATCRIRRLRYVVKADVASYFERIYQHNLINLLRSADCNSSVVNLLEKVLKAFTQNDSHGIIQGLFPSDFLGNFYLTTIDERQRVAETPSIRYVDDIYLFYASETEARKGLAGLCRDLRDEGLSLNESKTRILTAQDLIAEETEVDRLFERAKQEIREFVQTNAAYRIHGYGFQSLWSEEEELPDEEVSLMAVSELYARLDERPQKADQIERFCLPYFSLARDEQAIERSLGGIVDRPHMSSIYCSYLRRFVRDNPIVGARLEQIMIDPRVAYEWALIWPVAALIDAGAVSDSARTAAVRVVEDARSSEGLRAIAAQLVAKHGNASQRRNLRHQYEREPSQFVREAILFSTRHLPSNERNSCLSAWGSHSITNSLIGCAVRRLAS